MPARPSRWGASSAISSRGRVGGCRSPLGQREEESRKSQACKPLQVFGTDTRIVKEVSDQVIHDETDGAVIKTAHVAAEQAQEHYGTVTFDFEGGTQHLRTSHQIEVFRKLATGKALKEALPVENQASLAQHIVEVSKRRNNAEVSGALISRRCRGTDRFPGVRGGDVIEM